MRACSDYCSAGLLGATVRMMTGEVAGVRTAARTGVRAGVRTGTKTGVVAEAGFRTGVVPLLVMLLAGSVSGSRVRLDSQGGYRGVVVEVEEQISQQNCKVILTNIKVRNRE